MLIKIRRDVEEEWEKYNPTLRDKELIGVYLRNSSEISWKIGDGVTSYLDLPFIENIFLIKEFKVYLSKFAVTIELAPEIVKKEVMYDKA